MVLISIIFPRKTVIDFTDEVKVASFVFAIFSIAILASLTLISGPIALTLNTFTCFVCEAANLIKRFLSVLLKFGVPLAELIASLMLKVHIQN